MRRDVRLGQFYNCGLAGAVAIVAVVNYDDDKVRDWAAYIGIGTNKDDMSCAAQVAVSGCKLSAGDAHNFFPELPMEKWRR